jgi:hypothetical protein
MIVFYTDGSGHEYPAILRRGAPTYPPLGDTADLYVLNPSGGYTLLYGVERAIAAQRPNTWSITPWETAEVKP